MPWKSSGQAVAGLGPVCNPGLPTGEQTGGIAGAVKDAGGALAPGAAVEIFDETTGKFGAPSHLRPGRRLRGYLAFPWQLPGVGFDNGFRQYRGVAVPARINETTRHHAVLEAGAVQETVTVEAKPTLLVNSGSPTPTACELATGWIPPARF